MKRFSVPVKRSIGDFTATRDVWLSVNDNTDGFCFAKKDARASLLFAVGLNSEEIAGIGSDTREDPGAVFRDWSASGRRVALIHVLPEENKLLAVQRLSLSLVLVSRSTAKATLIGEELAEYPFLMDDVLFGFPQKPDQKDLDRLIRTVHDSAEISFCLMHQAEETLKLHGTAVPLFAIDHSPCSAYTFPVKSTLKTVAMTVDLFKNKMLQYNCSRMWQIETVIHEALVNAITYGNDMDAEKSISVEYEVGQKGLRVIVKDLGDGFDVSNISVPVGEEALERISGRGIYMMRKFSDVMYYNRKGNEILLFFRF